MTIARHFRVQVLAVCCAVFSAVSAWEGNVCLNESAVADASGKLVVLGTEGSWNNSGNGKENVFDGDIKTFFDPPSSANQLGSAWAGLELATSCMVTRVCYVGRKDNGGRIAGCLFQGANQPDFSDAETFHVAAPPSGWNPRTWVDVKLDNVYGPYKYLRIWGLYCGNAGEVEFWGLADSGASVPAAPAIDMSWYLNQCAGFRFTSDADIPQVYRIQRRATAKDPYETFAIAVPEKGNETCIWKERGSQLGGDYRVRGVNANGKGDWTYFSITSRLEAVGTWIGTEGSWSNHGDTGDKVFDGDPFTFFDAPDGGVAWTGLDLGQPQMVAGVRFVPRQSNAQRMVGGYFEGANQSNFMDARTLYTIREEPAYNTVTEVSFGDDANFFRYVRYVAPANNYGNVAEVSFLLPEGNLAGPDAPTLSTPPGFSLTNVTVALDYPVDGAEIYYTLDGSTPGGTETETCFRYTRPLVFGDVCSKTNRLALIPTNPPEMWNHGQYGWAAPATDQPDVNVLRARAFKKGLASTNEVVGTWLIGPVPDGHTLRVVSLQTDEANFFSDATGLMVPGDVYNELGWNGHSVGLPNANYFQHGEEWERPVVFELYETNREQVVAQLLGVRMHGNWSRSCAEKTMGFYARNEYGKKKVKYPLFGDEPDHAEFKRFLLRNSGNDWYKSGLRDAFGQSLFRGWVSCGTQGYEPAVVYINGAYWGIENFRHHYSKHFFEDWYGADPENLDYVKMASSRGYEVQEGDDEAYIRLCDYMNAHDFKTDTAAWEYVQTRIDIDNMIDYSIVNMYLGNTDWPNNNQGFWRERVEFSPTAPAPRDGRWRFVTFDTDHGLGLASDVGTDGVGQAKNHHFFKALCNNREFVNRFVSRYADLLNTCLAPARTKALLDQAADRVRGEIPRHVARWTRQHSLANWEGEINSIRSFLEGRESNVRSNLDSYFGVGSSFPLTVTTNGCGRIQVNSLATGEGDGCIALPYTGRYFANVPVKLTATPATGWRFIAWLVEGGEPQMTPTIEISVTQAMKVSALFRATEPPRVVVNEVMADADTSDWFELYNAGTADVDLGGCWLMDDSEKHLTQIPLGVTLAAGGYLLVRADDSCVTGLDEQGVLNMPFGLGKKGDEVNLWSADRSQLLAHVAFGATTLNVSVGCWPNGDTGAEAWGALTVPTPGAPNRSPSATGAWLPNGLSVQVEAGHPAALSCAVTNTTLTGSYALINPPTPAARISAAGEFTWSVPASAEAGAYAFRVAWASADGSATDETTLLVQVMREEEIVLPVSPTRPQAGATRAGAVPLVYWTESQHANGYTIERAASRDGTYEAVASVPKGISTWLDVDAAAQTNWYRVVAIGDDNLTASSEASRAWASGFVHKLEGLVVGTPGAWNNGSNTKEHLFDGDTSTFFDGPSNLAWGGLDLGSVGWRVVTRIRYWPRDGFPDRMKDSVFEVCKVSDGVTTIEDPETLYKIPATPPEGRWTAVSLAATNEWRYICYYDENGLGNANEIEFRGFDDVPKAPSALAVDTNVSMKAAVTWPAVPHAKGYLVWTNDVLRGYVPTNGVTVPRSAHHAVTIGISALNGSGKGEVKAVTLPPAPPPPFALIFR